MVKMTVCPPQNVANAVRTSLFRVAHGYTSPSKREGRSHYFYTPVRRTTSAAWHSKTNSPGLWCPPPESESLVTVSRNWSTYRTVCQVCFPRSVPEAPKRPLTRRKTLIPHRILEHTQPFLRYSEGNVGGVNVRRGLWQHRAGLSPRAARGN